MLLFGILLLFRCAPKLSRGNADVLLSSRRVENGFSGPFKYLLRDRRLIGRLDITILLLEVKLLDILKTNYCESICQGLAAVATAITNLFRLDLSVRSRGRHRADLRLSLKKPTPLSVHSADERTTPKILSTQRQSFPIHHFPGTTIRIYCVDSALASTRIFDWLLEKDSDHG